MNKLVSESEGAPHWASERVYLIFVFVEILRVRALVDIYFVDRRTTFWSETVDVFFLHIKHWDLNETIRVFDIIIAHFER